MNWPADMRCGTCAHWEQRGEYETGHHMGLGCCKAIPMLWHATQWKGDGAGREFKDEFKNTKAFAQDGSDYMADVLTLPDFGCVAYKGT